MALVTAVACSGAQTPAAGCGKDTDCRAPRVCERTVCVDPRPVAVAADVLPIPAGDAGVASPAVRGAPPFAMFGGDARHTGRRAGPAPAKPPKEVWKSAVGGVVSGSPTIGPDGTIYVASHDGSLHAFDPAGTPKW